MSKKGLIIVLMILLLVIASLLMAWCPIDQPMIFPPERRAETFSGSIQEKQ